MKKRILIALGATLLLVAPRLRAASDYLLEIDGIKGESRDSVHPESIEIESFSWGISQAAASGGGGGAGKASFQDFHFTMRVNKASPLLLLACARGEHIKKATLFVRKAGGTQEDYYEVTLENLLVSSYSQSGNSGSAAGDSRPIESLSLNFTKVIVKYTSDDGSVTSAEVDLTPTP